MEISTENLCEFALGDINDAVKTERDYCCVILGAVGPGVLGGPAETLWKMKETIKPGGYILLAKNFYSFMRQHPFHFRTHFFTVEKSYGFESKEETE